VHFVGRDSALAGLTSALDRVSAGRSVVVVEGAAGLGKSTLIRRVLDAVRGPRIARTAAVEGETLVRYSVAGSLLRELTGLAAVEPHEEITQVGGRLLSAISSRSGATVLVLDDAQWADAASVQALTFALRRLGSDPVLAVIGTRSLSDAEPLSRLVEAVRADLIQLGPLSVGEVGDLGARHGVPLSAAAARRLHAHTGGLPLHAVALLRELEPSVLNRTHGALPAPRSYGGLIQRRLSAGTAHMRTLVAALAILGDPVPLALVADVAGVADPVAALDDAVRAGLIEHRRDARGDLLHFGHDLTRAAVLDGLSPGRRIALHARAADHLDGVAALDQRAAAAIRPDAALCAELGKTAREEADSGAYERAVHHFLEASRLGPDPTTSRDLRLDAVETLVLAGDAAAAKALVADLRADLADEGDRARAGYLRGHLAVLDGRPAEAERLLLDAWDWCESAARPRLAALIAAQLSQLFTSAARNDDTALWAARGAQFAGDDARLATTATATLLASLVFSGRPAQALAQVLPEPATATALRTGRFDDVVGRGLVRLWTDDLTGARRDLAAVADPVLTGRPLRVRLLALAYLAEVEFRAGRWDDSLAASELAVSLAEDADHPWLRGLLHGIAALPLAGRGETDAAAAHVSAGLAADAAIGDVMSLVYPGVAGCLLAAARGDYEGVLTATDPLAELNPANGVLEPTVLQWCAYRVEALTATGALAAAAALLDLAEPLAAARDQR
jgi:hypothetical protein